MLLHHISELDTQCLIGIHAYLTKDGWVIPLWLQELEQTRKNNNEYATNK